MEEDIKKEQETPTSVESGQAVEKEKYLRLAADFDNYKKDEARRIGSALQYGNEKLILEVLSAVDDLEAAYHHAPESINEEWLKGLKQTLNRFGELLNKHGIHRIPTVGEKFDPLYHEALQQVQGKAGEEEMIVQEVRAGYTMQGKVIRPARVVINK